MRVVQLLFTLALVTGLCTQLSAQLISGYRAYDIDTAHQEWSAISGEFGNLLISTVDNPDTLHRPLGMNLGNIRLRFYSYTHGFDPTPALDTTLLFTGKARVHNILHLGSDDYIVCGGFTDTLILGADTLLNPESLSLDPFIFRVNGQGQILWHWSTHRPLHNYFHRLRGPYVYNNALLAVGLANDSTGWVVSLNPADGTFQWEELADGAKTISDAQILTSSTDTSLFITGSCAKNAQLFGIQVPVSLPITDHQSFLYRRKLRTQQGEFLKVVPHFTFNFEAEIIGRDAYLGTFHWLTPYMPDTNHYNFEQLYTQFRYNHWTNTYVDYGVDAKRHQGMYINVSNERANEWDLNESYAIYKADINPVNHFTLREYSLPFFITIFNIGIDSNQWLGLMDGMQLWVATIVPDKISYEITFGPSDTLVFPNIIPSHPRWALMGRDLNPNSVANTYRQLDFLVYPNPVTGRLLTIHFTAEVQNETQWILRDLQGKAVLNGQFSTAEATLDLNQLQSGLYLLEINRNNQKAVRKVVVP